MSDRTGYFVWHDLMTTDPARSVAFYTELFGWTITDIPMGSFTYRRIAVGDEAQAGLMPLDPAHGMASHWMPYLAVDDVDETVAAVDGLGGARCVPPMDVPNVGRFAVVDDPAGTPITAFRRVEAGRDLNDRRHHGLFCWDDLAVPDPDKVIPFYTALVGWRVETSHAGQGPYHVVSPRSTSGPDQGVGGIMQAPPGGEARPMWTPYIFVDDIDGETSRAVELGARLDMGPYDAGEVGVMSFLTDPTGARFALYGAAR